MLGRNGMGIYEYDEPMYRWGSVECVYDDGMCLYDGFVSPMEVETGGLRPLEGCEFGYDGKDLACGEGVGQFEVPVRWRISEECAYDPLCDFCGDVGNAWAVSTDSYSTPFGEMTEGDKDEAFTFTSLRNEDVGEEGELYSAQYRHLRPGLGRWIKRDPAGAVDGANLYRYVKNRPSVAVDRLGLFSLLANRQVTQPLSTTRALTPDVSLNVSYQLDGRLDFSPPDVPASLGPNYVGGVHKWGFVFGPGCNMPIQFVRLARRSAIRPSGDLIASHSHDWIVDKMTWFDPPLLGGGNGLTSDAAGANGGLPIGTRGEWAFQTFIYVNRRLVGNIQTTMSLRIVDQDAGGPFPAPEDQFDTDHYSRGAIVRASGQGTDGFSFSSIGTSILNATEAPEWVRTLPQTDQRWTERYWFVNRR